MQIKKWIATGLSALMAGATIAGAGLAATSLKDFPGFLASKTATTSALDAFVVVGADAKTSDVVGAVDLAARLAELSYSVVTTSGTTTVAGSFDRDGISIGTASGGDALSVGGTDYSNAYPAGAVVKNFHWTGLKDSTFTWRSNSYDFSEQLALGGVAMRHDYGTTGINGSLTMVVESGDVIYQYVFDKELSGTGDDSNKNYTYPVNIDMLGKTFSIVGTNTDKAVILTGSVGTVDATKGVTYGDYTIYGTLGSNDKWVKVVVQDKAGATVDTLVINEGDTKTSSAAKLDVQVTDVRALADGTVVGADIVVGAQGSTEKTYDTSADTTSTGSSSDRFPGTTDWGIRVASSNFTNANRGKLAAASIIEVVYAPTSTQYIKAGGSFKLPNDYGEVKLVGFGTEKFTTVTIKPVTSQSAYNSTGDVVGSNMNGLEINAVDEKGNDITSILAANNNAYAKAYILFPKSFGPGTNNNTYPVYFGFYDTANKRIKTADTNATVASGVGETATSTGTNPSSTRGVKMSGALVSGAVDVGLLAAGGGGTSLVTSEFAWVMLNRSGNDPRNNGNNVTYSYRLSYGGSGEKSDWRLNFTVSTNHTWIIGNATAGDPNNFNVMFDFRNKTTWNTDTAPEFRLGGTTTTSESTEVNVTTETSKQNVGKSSQDVVDDNGLIIVSPDGNGASDTVKFKVGAKELTARVQVGKQTSTTTGGETVNKVAAISSAVAKLDSEVGSAEKAKHLILVGGPCVNKLTAEALGKKYPACGASSGITTDTALIQAVDGAFATGKVALVIAGWEADNTRLATSVLQNYDKHLKDVIAGKVTVTGTVAAPVVKAEAAAKTS